MAPSVWVLREKQKFRVTIWGLKAGVCISASFGTTLDTLDTRCAM